ncbi:MAG: endonuclease V [Phycisphaerales bacterium]|nr:MAG: endonuclease V [Phycisphaerales bacterium]
MKVPRCPHRWNVTPVKAAEIQRKLADRVRETSLPGTPRLVAGADMAIAHDGQQCIAGVVVWDWRAGTVVEQKSAQRILSFPYVPGLLSFREAPAVLAAIRKLKHQPDLLMLDGQGRAHPRGLGLACHVGLILDRPTLGCAKSRLCGEHSGPGVTRGRRAALSLDGRIVGAVVRTRDRVKPVYVSVGHRITLTDAVDWVLRCCRSFRLPEPTRLAHHYVTRLRSQ